jgi:7-cyano-7-deazaguanine synthase
MIMDEDKRALILFSGGSDSILMLELALRVRKEPYCLMIDYGQLHKEELDFGKKYLDGVNSRSDKILVKYNTVSIRGLSANSGLTGDGQQNIYQGVHSHWVPGRNTMFLAVSFSEAESQGITEIWYGPDFSDRIGLFPDCYQEYVVKIDELYKIAGSYPINVRAPLMGMTKDMVLALLANYGITKDQMFSGYGEFS